MFQFIMQQILNICDDILVFGKSQRQHNEVLWDVIKSKSESGLTLNKAKYKLNKSELEFCGHVFSAKGVKIQPKRVETNMNMKAPKTPAEMCSLLGMEQFSHRRLVRVWKVWLLHLQRRCDTRDGSQATNSHPWQSTSVATSTTGETQFAAAALSVYD